MPRPARRPQDRSQNRCAALLWNRGNRCKNDAALGAMYCPAHLCLLAPLEWVTAGYARALDDGARPRFTSAAYATLSEEVSLARYELSALVRAGAPAASILAGIGTVARLIRLQRQIEAIPFPRGHGRSRNAQAAIQSRRPQDPTSFTSS